MKVLLISFIFTLVPFLVGCGNTGTTGTTGNTVIVANDLDNDGIKDVFDIDDNNDGLIEISDADELNNIRYDLFGTSYKIGNSDLGSSLGCGEDGCNGYQLINDIDLDPNGSGVKNWDPVGTESAVFSAIFDGGNYTIRNLIISSASERIGFIGVMGYQSVSVVKNVHFRGGSVSTIGDVKSIGVVAGNTGKNGIVENVSSDLDVLITGGLGGGLVGEHDGIIRSSYSTGNIMSGSSYHSVLGGLVGAFAGSIRYSYASGTVTSGSGASNIGGLAGSSYGIITNCYSTSDLISNSLYIIRVGGLVGSFSGDYIGRSYFSGTITGKTGNSNLERIGAILGQDRRDIRNMAFKAFSSNYYKYGTITGLDGNDFENIIDSEDILAVYESDLLYLTAASTKIDFPGRSWSERSWDFSEGKYPSLKLYSVDKDGNKIEGLILCGQPDTHTQCEQEDKNLSLAIP